MALVTGPWLRATPLIAAAALVSHSAPANMAAPVRLPGQTTAPVAPGAGLVILHEQLSFECDEEAGEPRCRFVAIYRVHNPGAAAVTGQGAFYGVRSEQVQVTEGGRSIVAPLSDAQAMQLDAAVVRANQPEPSTPEASPRAFHWLERQGDVSRTGFVLSVAPGARTEIRATGVMAPGRDRIPRGYTWSPIAGRHPWLHAGDASRRWYRFEYLLGPLRTWGGRPRIEVRWRWPRAWECTTGLDSAPTEAAGRATLRSVVTLAEEPELDAIELYCGLPGALVEHGGPVLGFGTVTGSGAASGARGYLGWELGRDAWVLGASVHGDLKGRATVAVTGEVATDHLLIIPSLALGVGVPVQIAPEPRLGVRGQGTLTFYPVGFSTSVDWFPASHDAEVLLLGRLSL